MTTTETGGWQALVLHPADDVAVALRDLVAGTDVDVRRPDGRAHVVVRDAIPLGHKFALRAIDAGTPIRKYGEVIGAASGAIAAGAHVHIHNLASLRARRTR